MLRDVVILTYFTERSTQSVYERSIERASVVALCALRVSCGSYLEAGPDRRASERAINCVIVCLLFTLSVVGRFLLVG